MAIVGLTDRSTGRAVADADVRYLGAGDTTVTKQSNTFNGANQLVQLDASGDLAANSVKFNNAPTLGSFVEGQLFYDKTWKCPAMTMAGDVTLQIGQETMVRVYNATGSVIPDGSAVYITGAHTGVGDDPSVATVALADASDTTKCTILGVTTQAIADSNYGMVTVRGHINAIKTDYSGWTAGETLYLSDTTPGALQDTPPDEPSMRVIVATLIVAHATAGRILVSANNIPRVVDLSDTSQATPVDGDTLVRQGASWIYRQVAVSAGTGVVGFLDNTPSVDDYFSLVTSPVTTTSTQYASAIVPAGTTSLIKGFMYNQASNRTIWDGGNWKFTTYAYVSAAGGNNPITIGVYDVQAPGGTVTVTGSGTSRTATLSGYTGSPFAAGDANASMLLSGYVQTAGGTFQITGFTSASVVTIATASGYVNESAVAYSVHKYVFQVVTDDINQTGTPLHYDVATTQAERALLGLTDRIALRYHFTNNSSSSKTAHIAFNGSTYATSFITPFSTRHNELAGLNLGDYRHLTAAQHSALITGSLAATQVAYGAGTNSVAGSNSFIYDSVNKRIGMSDSSTLFVPLASLHLSKDTNTGLRADTYSNTAAAVAGVQLYKARGTAASPAAVQLGDSLGFMAAYGRGATGFSSTSRAKMEMLAAENWTDAAHGTYISFSTTTTGTIIPVERVRIESSGVLTALYRVTSPLVSATLNNEFFGALSGNTSSTGNNNTALGHSVMPVATSAANCVGVGYQALNSLTGGGSNTAVGASALKANTNGSNNSAFGINALLGNITGIQNTSIGADSMRAVTATNNNTAVGYSALRGTTGGNNTAVGHSALYATTGSGSVALGYFAGRYETGSNAFYVDNQDRLNTVPNQERGMALLYGTFNSTPSSQTLTVNAYLTVAYGVTSSKGASSLHNEFFGASAGNISATGFDNTTVGYNTLPLITSGSRNVAIGARALSSSLDGYNNIAIGADALAALTTGYGNVAIGDSSLIYNATGSHNTAIGDTALINSVTGSNSTAIGAAALQNSDGGSNNTAVGYSASKATTTAANSTALGASALVTATSGGSNTAIGTNALRSVQTGSRNVAIGYWAGGYELGDDAFYVDNRSRVNTEGDKAGALLYGTFNATPSSQTLFANATLTALGSVSVNGAAASDKAIQWQEAGVTVWKRYTKANEDGEFLHDYNANLGTDAFVMSTTGRMGFNKQSPVMNYHTRRYNYASTGLDDCVVRGTFTGRLQRVYYIQINALGTPDTFQWKVSLDNGVTYGSFSSSIPCALTPTLIEKGVSVAFENTTGHTLQDGWLTTAYPQTPQANLSVAPPLMTEILVTTDYTAGTPVWKDVTGDLSCSESALVTGVLPAGSTTGAVCFGLVTMYDSVYVRAYSAANVTVVTEYWNGSDWTQMTLASHEYVDGTTNWTAPGRVGWNRNLLTGWTKTIPPGMSGAGYNLYWVRMRTSSAPATAVGLYSITPTGEYRFAVFNSFLDSAPAFSYTGGQRMYVTGDAYVQDKTISPLKGYRWRTSAAYNDFDACGTPLFVSVYQSAGFTGTQRFYQRMYSAVSRMELEADVLDFQYSGRSNFPTCRLTSASWIHNYSATDCDFIINKYLTGVAYTYDAGLDTHTFRGATTITAPSAAIIPLTLKGSAAQTANLQEWQNSVGATLASVDALGVYTGLLRDVVTTVTGNTTLAQTKTLVEQTQSGITTSLWAAPLTGDRITIKNTSIGSNTVDGNGKTIDGNASLTLTAGDSATLVYNGTQWLIFSIGNTQSTVEQWVSTPATFSSAGIKGQLAWDGVYLWTCVATDTWVRSAQERA